ncbi:MAG: hypothetical protein HRJ53_05785 [Acidobacteria bacterium Pan2503]|uniref:Uncharacterized protein n=1 Tax=Candidatus Acidiferrum panamense TaxID=2741543 RepID=A0A7V8NNG6_9BACT|nr:hypothetical protein [Candidatus Acidoferrum panamensis]
MPRTFTTIHSRWRLNLNVAQSGVDDRFRMVVPVYLEYDDAFASPG